MNPADVEAVRNWIRANPRLTVRERVNLLQLALAHAEQVRLNRALATRCAGLVEIVAGRAARAVTHPCG